MEAVGTVGLELNAANNFIFRTFKLKRFNFLQNAEICVLKLLILLVLVKLEVVSEKIKNFVLAKALLDWVNLNFQKF